MYAMRKWGGDYPASMKGYSTYTYVAVYKDISEKVVQIYENLATESKIFCKMSGLPRSIQETDYVIYWVLAMVRFL